MADDVILRAAYLTVGGAEVLPEQEFAGDVRCACASAWYCVTLMLSYDCTFSVFYIADVSLQREARQGGTQRSWVDPVICLPFVF